MNKKITKAAATTICAAACAAAFALSAAGCGGEDYKAQSYYNKTITFTGGAYTYGFDTVGASDGYNDGKEDGKGERDTTQRKIVEKYWDKIDWEEMGLIPAPKNSDEVKTFLDTAQTKVFEVLKDLSFTVTKTDTVTLTVNMNDELKDFGGWGTSITVPLYENGEELNLEGFSYSLEEGYHGVGVKEDGNKRLIIEVMMTKPYADVGGKKNVYKDSAHITMHWDTKITNDDGGYYYNNVARIDTWFDGLGNFTAKPVINAEGGEHIGTVLSVNYYPEITITDAQ